jgi:NADPH:quinone reductase-like Zn-dependent oxidoreductase
MKAITQQHYGSADALEFRDLNKPVPTDEEVLLRVFAAGVDRGVWHHGAKSLACWECPIQPTPAGPETASRRSAEIQFY